MRATVVRRLLSTCTVACATCLSTIGAAQPAEQPDTAPETSGTAGDIVRDDSRLAPPPTADDAFDAPPAGGSDPGTANPSYLEGSQRSAQSPEQARGWEEPPGVSEEDVVLAGPRAILFLPNLALHVAFLPLRGAATLTDRHKLIDRTLNLLYFNDARTAGIFPTLSVETGYGVSFGANLFHNDLFGHEEHISARAAYGGIYQQGYQALFEGDRVGGSRLWLEARVRYEKKPALLFHGIGDSPDGSRDVADQDPRAVSVATRFRQERFLGLLSAGPTLGQPGNQTQVGLTAAFNRRVFGSEQRDLDEPSVGEVYETGQLTGFHDAVHLLELDANLSYDGTDHADFPSRGVFLELFGGRSVPVDAYEFWRYGLECAVFVNLYRNNRVLVLRGATEAVNGPRREIPFTELPRLGGSQRLRGYVQDRFRDRVAAVGTVEYRYPVHELVSGSLFVDAGRVGSSHARVFGADHFDDWRAGAGGGLTLHSKDREDVIFRLEMAYGEGLTVFFSTDPLRAFTKRSRQL